MSDVCDSFWMRRALALARKGIGTSRPNPLVGALLVSKGKLLGKGFHHAPGESHAEVLAIDEAGDRALGAVLYVNLEPCNHWGRTPPCTEAIIKAGIRRVVIGMLDPDPNVLGGGVTRLAEAGIEISVGVLEHEAKELNRAWITAVTECRPYVILKLARSLDGKIGIKDGDGFHRFPLSSSRALWQVQRLRRYSGAVLVGLGTVDVDDPLLNNRTGRGLDPLKVILDSNLKISPQSKLFFTGGRVLLAAGEQASDERVAFFKGKGVEVIKFPQKEGRIELKEVLSSLFKQGIQTVLCEGGSKVASSFIKERLVDRLVIYQSSNLIGKKGIPAFCIEQTVDFFNLVSVKKIGPDALLVFDRKK